MKQALRAWYKRIDSYMISNQVNRSNNKPTLYVKTNKEGQILIVCLYVDDLIFTRNLSIDMFKSEMMKEFEMTDLGLTRYFLDIEVIQCDKGIFICQSRYIKDVLKRFKMMDSDLASTPITTGTKLRKEEKGSNVEATIFKRIFGSLMYMIATRLDIMYSVSFISIFIESPQNSHWQVGKRILRYIVGTMGYGILYSITIFFGLIG